MMATPYQTTIHLIRKTVCSENTDMQSQTPPHNTNTSYSSQIYSVQTKTTVNHHSQDSSPLFLADPTSPPSGEQRKSVIPHKWQLYVPLDPYTIRANQMSEHHSHRHRQSMTARETCDLHDTYLTFHTCQSPITTDIVPAHMYRHQDTL